jgi:hypothetical protein
MSEPEGAAQQSAMPRWVNIVVRLLPAIGRFLAELAKAFRLIADGGGAHPHQ